VCTVTWLTSDDSYELFCNRDERHERGEAAPPRVFSMGGVEVVAPRDPDGGGTWICANDRGLAVCLLNGYRAADDLEPADHFRSRGLLVLELAQAADSATALALLSAAHLAPYRSFEVLLMDATGPHVAVWDRATASLSRRVPSLPLVSCPVRTGEVRAARRLTLEQIATRRGRLDARGLAEFHRSRHANGGIWSVSMHHTKAATRSHTHLRVTRDRVECTYVPGRPCETAAGAPIRIDRRG